MSREQTFLVMLTILLLTSVVSLSALGVQDLGVYLGLLSLSYFANSFIFRPRRRTIDFVGIGLLYYTLIFLANDLRVL